MAVLDEPVKEVVEIQNYIDGEWVDSKSTKICHGNNPIVFCRLLNTKNVAVPKKAKIPPRDCVKKIPIVTVIVIKPANIFNQYFF